MIDNHDMTMTRQRLLIVGGVAGGASCAARARRLDESLEIIMFERGDFVSFANCGLPYHVGEIIPDEEDLLVASPELFRARFAVDVRVRHEVIAIDRSARTITVRDHAAGREYRETYDKLVLSPGAAPIRPPLPGVDAPGVFTLRTIPDARAIRAWIEEKRARRAAVVGGGFIGLEMAENLAARGLGVTVIEKLPHIFPACDSEMIVAVEEELGRRGVTLRLGDGLRAIAPQERGLRVSTESGAESDADLVMLAIGVKPETGLARDAGLELGKSGGIKVDAQMRTSDANIWAVGDAVEVQDVVSGGEALVPLAGPANRQGRIAADALCGRPSRFRGVQSTAVCGLFGMTVATTGLSEQRLKRAGGIAYDKVYLHAQSHAGYYPGAEPFRLKLVFSVPDGRILGAQAVGGEGVEKRIDVISMALQKQGTVFDLEEAELCYAPQFGSAKDPVNVAGMVAANALRGDAPLAHWAEALTLGGVILDVREPGEYAKGHIEGALNIPLGKLRERAGELPSGKTILVHCAGGQRSYYAVRQLRQRGFDARNISGGYRSYLDHARSQGR